jgi:integrase
MLTCFRSATTGRIPVTSEVGRLRFEEALTDLVNYHKANGRESDKLEGRIKKHLTPCFGGRKMAEITVATINAYIAKRKAEVVVIRARTKRTRKGVVAIPERRKGVQNATINRELAWLRQMFTLAVRAGKLITKPHIELLEEDNVRQGFLEADQLQEVLSCLPDDLRAPVEFAYLTGWRMKSEVLPLQWKQVDFKAGEIRLEPGTTKNKRGRTFPMTQRLRTLLETQQAYRERLRKQELMTGFGSDPVFFRMVAKGRGGDKEPRKIVTLVRMFKTACAKAGYPGRIPHDMRRARRYETWNEPVSRAASRWRSQVTRPNRCTDVTTSSRRRT